MLLVEPSGLDRSSAQIPSAGKVTLASCQSRRWDPYTGRAPTRCIPSRLTWDFPLETTNPPGAVRGTGKARPVPKPAREGWPRKG